MIIYRAENLLNGKVYIGQTVRGLGDRIKEHQRKNTKSLLGKAMKKYGTEAFKIDIVYVAKSLEDLNIAEIAWIRYEDCLAPNGYNLVEGGGGTVGYKHPPETKSKMSKAKEGMYYGKDNPFYGRTHSEETRSKMRGRVMSEENKANLKASHHVRPIRNITTEKVYSSIKEAAADTGILSTHITRVCKGKRKSCGGFQWEYL